MPLYFVTGNAGKFREIQAALPQIEQLKLDLDETQSLDPQAVIEHKLNQAASLHDGEFIVEDTAVMLRCLNDLPGTLIKWFYEALGNQGLAELVHRYDDHSVTAKTTIGYRSRTGRISYFTGEIKGVVVAPRGDLTAFGWNAIFQPDGHDRTFAEMTVAEKNRISMRGLAAAKLKTHLSTTADGTS